MSFLDKMKKKAEELELDKKAKDLQEAATKAATQAREKAGDYAAGNRDKIDSYVDKAATTIDAKTQGKYADHVAKARQGVGKGVDKLAESAPRTGTGGAPLADPTVDSPFPLDPEAPRAPHADSPHADSQHADGAHPHTDS
ncbi:MAG: hypothetical protein JWP82_669, partial [Humibacillus sp.]|nr:hypothetical protein [Humibacillus sp.]